MEVRLLLLAAVGCLLEVVESEDEKELVATVGFQEEADCLGYALKQAEGGDLSLLVGLVVVRRGWTLQGRLRGGPVGMSVDPLEREYAGGGTGGEGQK